MPRRKPIRRIHWVAYLWPGLPHLWVRGSLAGLTLALAFSVLLNVLVLATLVWPAWLETRLKFACIAAAAALWLAALYETRGELRRLAAERDAPDPPPEQTTNPNDTLLRQAQGEYLRGDWTAAEKTLRRALRNDRRDVEARLWLATLLRRTGRPKQARRRLRRLERLDDAAPWRYEIEQEWTRLDGPRLGIAAEEAADDDAANETIISTTNETTEATDNDPTRSHAGTAPETTRRAA